MAVFPDIVPLPPPAPPPGITATTVTTGPLIPPIERIKLFSSAQWEEFILEWADSLRNDYSRVDRCGGAGDMGRDVIATCKHDGSTWDNYQCKHYAEALQPAQIWVELGKLAYHTYCGHFTYPRRYFFVAPRGAGTSLSNLLKRPADLKAKLIENWDTHCRDNITAERPVPLDTALRAHLDSLDFSIFDSVPPLRLIDQHAKTRWHASRFGGGLPPRPQPLLPPGTPMPHEATYVQRLLEAYADHLGRNIAAPADIASVVPLNGHFSDSRIEFYSAESLRAFSRDTLPPGEYEKLQDEIHSGIRDQVRATHPDGYRRVVAVVATARGLQLTDHPLISCLSVRDRGGICHQLANDDKVKWI